MGMRVSNDVSKIGQLAFLPFRAKYWTVVSKIKHLKSDFGDYDAIRGPKWRTRKVFFFGPK